MFNSLSVMQITLSIVCRHPSILRKHVTHIIFPSSILVYFILFGRFMREIFSLGNAR